MLSPFYDFIPYILGSCLLAVLFVLATRRKPEREVEPATAGDGYHYKSKPNISFEQIKRENHKKPPPFGNRTVGKSPALAAPYGRKPTIPLTPRMLERVNVERRRRGAPSLNRRGVTNAIAHPWDRAEVRQPQTTSDWLTYLIMYDVFIADHQQSQCSGVGGIRIDPNLSYNGQGGELAGAGASGDWTAAPVTATIAAGIAVGASAEYLTSQDPERPNGPLVGDGPSVASDYRSGDTVGGYDSAPSSMNPDPTPSYSAPDPTPGGDGS